MATADLNQTKVDEFAEKMLGVVNSAAISLMTSIGHRTGLFDKMASLDWVTSQGLADAAGLSERYVREWLGAMLVGGIVEHNTDDATYRLPAEHAACLTRAATPNNMAGFTQWIAVLGGVEDLVVEAFKHGRGVPYSAYGRFHEVMAEESGQTVVAALLEHILPLDTDLTRRLEQGIDVLDVGCGAGQAMLLLAETFPRSYFVGYDLSTEAIGRAQADANRRRLTNIRFAARDVSLLDGSERFDLITAFDAIHDQARPDAVLRGIATSLRPSGLFLMQDIKAHTCHHQNLGNPVGPLIYTISCMHCMSVSLAMGGPGVGAAWGKEKALSMLAEAGFGNVDVRELPHDITNYYYLARP